MASTTISPPTAHSSRMSLLTLLVFIIILLGAIFYVKPLWDDVSSLSMGRDEKQVQKGTLSQQLSDLQSVQQSLGGASEVSRQTTLDAIPQRLEQDKLIKDITGIAQKNDIILNGVTFGVTTNSTERIKRATVSANLTGDMGTLLGFLKGIESNPRKMLVRNVTVQTGQTETGIPRVNFNVNIEAYYQDRI